MGHYPTGVVAVSAMIDEAPVSMIVGTFTSVSLEPPLVSFMPMKSSGTYQRLRNAEHLCFSVLGDDQQDVCRILASRNDDKFDHVRWTATDFGAPRIEGATAYVHGRIANEYDAGDHLITLCDVDDLEANSRQNPLVFLKGAYGGIQLAA